MPVISGVTITPTDTGATVAWTTDENSDSQVAWGTTLPYSATSTLDTTQTTSHSVMITGLMPDTTYHVEALSNDASSSLGVSPDTTFTTLSSASSSTTVSSSTAPVISSIVATPTDTGATISWTTDQNADSQVSYGTTTSYGASTTLDSTQVMNHSEMITGLMPDTAYHFMVKSMNGSGQMTSSPDQTFMTTDASGTGTTTGNPSFQSQLDMIKQRLLLIEQELMALLNGQGGAAGNGGGIGTSTQPMTANPSIDQNGMTGYRGGSIDFGGHNFGHEEQIKVMLNGMQVATAHADGGGNFSTGSFSLPTTAGTYTYTFTGDSGDSATATVTVM